MVLLERKVFIVSGDVFFTQALLGLHLLFLFLVLILILLNSRLVLTGGLCLVVSQKLFDVVV